jgi:hypothetical protein
MQKEHSLKESLTTGIHKVEHVVDDFVYDTWHVRLHKKAKKHVHALRKRPEHHKQIIAFSAAFVFTCFVFIAWYYISFPKIISSYKVQKKDNISSNPLVDIQKRLENNTQ